MKYIKGHENTPFSGIPFLRHRDDSDIHPYNILVSGIGCDDGSPVVDTTYEYNSDDDIFTLNWSVENANNASVFFSDFQKEEDILLVDNSSDGSFSWEYQGGSSHLTYYFVKADNYCCTIFSDPCTLPRILDVDAETGGIGIDATGSIIHTFCLNNFRMTIGIHYDSNVGDVSVLVNNEEASLIDTEDPSHYEIFFDYGYNLPRFLNIESKSDCYVNGHKVIVETSCCDRKQSGVLEITQAPNIQASCTGEYPFGDGGTLSITEFNLDLSNLAGSHLFEICYGSPIRTNLNNPLPNSIWGSGRCSLLTDRVLNLNLPFSIRSERNFLGFGRTTKYFSEGILNVEFYSIVGQQFTTLIIDFPIIQAIIHEEEKDGDGNIVYSRNDFLIDPGNFGRLSILHPECIDFLNKEIKFLIQALTLSFGNQHPLSSDLMGQGPLCGLQGIDECAQQTFFLNGCSSFIKLENPSLKYNFFHI